MLNVRTSPRATKDSKVPLFNGNKHRLPDESYKGNLLRKGDKEKNLRILRLKSNVQETSERRRLITLLISNQMTNQNKRVRQLLRSKGEKLDKAMPFHIHIHIPIDIYQATLSSQERDGLSARKPGEVEEGSTVFRSLTQ